MNELPNDPTLKDINAYKKKLNWGEVPAIYHMATSTIGELDGILTHGFDSAYKRMFNKNQWNLSFLQAYKDKDGNTQVTHKPKIALRHIFNEQNYELHCYPIVQGERINRGLLKHPMCPFENWQPESMRMLFRVSSFIPFIIYSFQGGDEADMALIKYAHLRIEELIDILRESFDVIDIIGYSVADFCLEISRRKHTHEVSELLDNQDQPPEY
jgi:hypothetical protein